MRDFLLPPGREEAPMDVFLLMIILALAAGLIGLIELISRLEGK